MDIKNIKNEIRIYCMNLILNSNVKDWNEYSYYKDNFAINIDKNSFNIFTVIIYEETGLRRTRNHVVEFDINWCWNRKERQNRFKLRKKFEEIDSYIINKKDYEDTLKTYSLLPIKELRRNKLEFIKKELKK